MACIEDLITAIEDLLETVQTKKDCCDDNVTYTPGTQPSTEIVPNEGDPPATYGETTVADWDEWIDYLCYQAHVYVDNLIDVANQLNGATYPAWITIGLIAALLVLLSFSGIGLPVAFGLAATVVGSLVTLGAGTVFTAAATALETARDDIVCAIIQGTSLSDAVEDALSSGVAWDAFYTFIDYDAATAVLYEGGWDGEYLDPQTRTDCECMFLYDFLADWDDTLRSPDWILGPRSTWGGDSSCANTNHIKMHPISGNPATAAAELADAASRAGFPWPGIPRVGFVHQMEVTYTCGSLFESYGKEIWLKVLYEDSTFDTVQGPSSAGEHTVVLRGSDVKEVQADGPTNKDCIRIECPGLGSGHLNAQVCVTSARVWGSVSGT